MAKSTLITDYLSYGTHAARPATPNIPTGCGAVYYETDTSHFFGWTGSGWQQIDVGNSASSPPTVVRSAIDSAGTNNITLGGAPANGNLLVAMCFNPATISPGTGWTSRDGNSSGTDFGQIFTKVAGAGESATQTPLASSPGGTGLICMWEVNGQNGSNFYVTGASQAEVTAASSASPLLANIPTGLTLGAMSLVTTPTISAMYNMTQDQIVNSGNRRGVMGHSIASTPVGQILAAFSASGNSKAAICSITS